MTPTVRRCFGRGHAPASLRGGIPLLLACLALAACTTAEIPASCRAGQSIACSCDGGVAGLRACSAAGTYEACVCAARADVVMDVKAPPADTADDASPDDASPDDASPDVNPSPDLGTDGAGGRDAAGDAAPAVTCPSPAQMCGSHCANTALDPDHCGACGRACEAGEVCDDGACTRPRMAATVFTTCFNTVDGLRCVGCPDRFTGCVAIDPSVLNDTVTLRDVSTVPRTSPDPLWATQVMPTQPIEGLVVNGYAPMCVISDGTLRCPPCDAGSTVTGCGYPSELRPVPGLTGRIVDAVHLSYTSSEPRPLAGCARRDDGTTACWTAEGSLRDVSFPSPVRQFELGRQLGIADDGAFSTLYALAQNGRVYRLAPGATVPVDVLPPGQRARDFDVDSTNGRVCVRLEDRTVACAPGNNDTAFQPVAGLTNIVDVEVTDSYGHLIARDGEGRVWCANGPCRTGTTTAPDVTRPVRIPGIRDAVELVGGGVALARTLDGRVRAWSRGPRYSDGRALPDATTDVPGVVPGVFFPTRRPWQRDEIPEGTTRCALLDWGGLAVFPDSCFPRCSAETRAAWTACGDDACRRDAVTADTTPLIPASMGALRARLTCEACTRLQNDFCEYDVCPVEAALIGYCDAGAITGSRCTTARARLDACKTRRATIFARCREANVLRCFP